MHFSSITSIRKSCALRDNVEKYGTSTEDTDNLIKRRMRFACWISRATRAEAHAHAKAPAHKNTRAHACTNTHKNMSCLLLFHGSSGFVNAPDYYVIRALPVLSLIKIHLSVPDTIAYSARNMTHLQLSALQ